ncbi:Rossmann-like and DUF2520 domain-containing protein [Chloroflexota bacterium]
MPNIGFIGAGTVGTALAVRLRDKGYMVTAVASRTLASAERLASMVDGCKVKYSLQPLAEAADVVFITTPDDVIPGVVEQINWHTGQSVVHCSGADSLDILDPAAGSGARVGAFHPLQTFASITHALENIPGSTFAVEAEEPLLGTLKEMALALNGQSIELKPGDKVIYHTAAVFACNYLVALVKLATDLWQTFDVPPREATQALLPLLRGTINNLDNVGLPNCLTGPIARGDLGTVRKHLAALKARAPELLPSYRELGRQTVPIALTKGKIDDQVAKELREALREPIFKTSNTGE